MFALEKVVNLHTLSDRSVKPKNQLMMKKFLEVLMDEEGMLHFSTDLEFADNLINPPTDEAAHVVENDEMNRRAIRSMISDIWGNKSIHPSKAIRYLAMAEIAACAEPYSRAEEFWSTMMFDYLPQYEKFASALKKPYGYDPSKVIRPLTVSCPNGMPPLPFPMGFGKTKS